MPLVEFVQGNIRCDFLEGLKVLKVQRAHQTWQLGSLYLF